MNVNNIYSKKNFYKHIESMGVKTRLIEFIDYKGMSRRSFSLGIGASSSFVNSISKSIGTEYIDRIKEKFPELNISWLMTGDGQMLNGSAPAVPAGSGVPYYDLDVTASVTESFNDVREEVQYYINFPPLNDCDAAFPVFGESMIPDFYPGEVIMVREIRNVNSMLWGEPYLIITNAACDNMRTIKNVYLSEDRQSFILRATNPRYAGDTVVAIDNVLKIFLVKGKLNRRQL